MQLQEKKLVYVQCPAIKNKEQKALYVPVLSYFGGVFSFTLMYAIETISLLFSGILRSF